MGRQAYLAKIAFGRSAFEPTPDITESDAYIQLDSSQAELPTRYEDATENNYIQLYDERGNPINPRSREYGKKLRNAQNDVLAAVGVVERRPSPAETLPGSYEERLSALDAEDTTGNVVALTTSVTQLLCIWWVGTVRDRLLTFRYPDAVHFAQVIASEHAISGSAVAYTGFASKLCATIYTQSILFGAFTYHPLEHLLCLMGASSKARKLLRRSKGVLKFGLRLGLEVLLYTFSYHYSLQRLGLIPNWPLLPSRASFVPFSRASPLLPFSLYYDPSTSVLACIKATMTSPVALACVEHIYEQWVFAAINDAVDASVIRPQNPDLISPEAAQRHRTTTILGLRRKAPQSVRRAISKLLTSLGWGIPFLPDNTGHALSSQALHPPGLTERQTIDLGDTTITDVTPLLLPVVQAPDTFATEMVEERNVAVSMLAVGEPERPASPLSPTLLLPRHDDTDPRIRITSREGVVEMEVRLPRILSTHIEVVDTPGLAQTERSNQQRHESHARSDRPYHRVSRLSRNPSQMIGAVVKGQLVALAVLPVRLLVLRLIASHFLASQGDHTIISRAVEPLPNLRDLSWSSIGAQLSRIALCSASEVAIDLGLWGLQYVSVVNIGKSVFGWGML